MGDQIHIIVKGKVQGVYFREFTKRKALSLGLNGTVKNLPNGSVEIFAGGDKDRLEELKEWCWEGSPYSRVDAVTVFQDVSVTDLSTFQVIF
jgi:acylphosphatase